MMLKDIDLNWMGYRMRKHGRTKRIRVMHILHSVYMRFSIVMKKSQKIWINITKKFRLLSRSYLNLKTELEISQEWAFSQYFRKFQTDRKYSWYF